jgi:predicted nucleic acid-binding protein
LTAFVLDASVAVKWLVPAPAPSQSETLIAESIQLLQRYSDGEVNFFVPDVFWAEVGNVMWKGVRQRRWSSVVAESAIEEIRNRNFFTVSTLTLLPEAIKIALIHDRSVYDCLYVALAIQCRIEMVTADERLANALAARFPVKWLGAFAID